MMLKTIKIYKTHIEISPYKLGDNEKFERSMSVYIDAEFRFEPIGYYVYNNILYVPRGTNLFFLERMFGVKPILIHDNDEYSLIKKSKIKYPPRNQIQKDAIDFLTNRGKYIKGLRYSQQALILDTGDGKTYTMVNSILDYQIKTIIITHQESIKNQWINTFKNMTNVTRDRLINISSSTCIEKIMENKLSGDIYFVNHRTLNSYAKTNGWNSIRDFFKKIKVGIKVYDEAHLEFKNILRVDMFSNVFKTFYLTANFSRSNTNESKLFKKCFSSVFKFGEETLSYEEKRRHIIYVPVLYRSNPTPMDLTGVVNSYGFSVLNFSDYALHRDPDETQFRILHYVYDIACKIDGRILITVPKIDDIEFIYEKMKRLYPNSKKTIGIMHSKKNKDDNEYVKDHADVIISTIKHNGTGSDIYKLRCVINLEPFSSKITSNQLPGRLREYAPDKDTYFFDLIDISFKTCENQYKTKLQYLRKKCKEVQVMKI